MTDKHLDLLYEALLMITSALEKSRGACPVPNFDDTRCLWEKCGVCGKSLQAGTETFCPKCGTKVLWPDTPME